MLLFLVLDKVKKKYGHLGNDVLLVELEKDSHGLGLSLAGHKDRNKMAVFVCGINPNGAAYKKGNIRVGDEILEVCQHFSIKLMLSYYTDGFFFYK